MPPVRTTLTLDDDLVAKLKDLAQRSRVSFKELVNSLLKRGLAAQETSQKSKKPFRVEPFRSPFRAGVDPLGLNKLVDELETQRPASRSS